MRLILLASSLAALSIPSSALAAPAWVPKETISAATGSLSHGAHDIGVNGSGDSVAAFIKESGGSSILAVAVREQGGPWVVEDIADAAATSRPKVAVNGGGAAVVVFERPGGSENVVGAISRPAGGDWGAVETISDDDVPYDAERLSVGIGTSGGAVAVWDYDGQAAPASSARSASGTWGSPETISCDDFTDCTWLSVAVDKTGDAVVVYRYHNGAYVRVGAQARAPGGAWGGEQTLSDTQDAGIPAVDIDPNGNATAIFRQQQGGTHEIRSATRPANGSWPAFAERNWSRAQRASPAI